MPEPLLALLKLLLLALIYLFFARVLRAVWAEMNPTPATPAAAGGASRGGGRAAAAAPTATKPAAPRPVSGREYIRIAEPADRRGTRFDLDDEATLGRAAGCTIALTDDDTVSQLHARIFRRDGKLMVEDLGSTNGTFLNRKRVSAPTAMRKGDRLQVGKTILEVAR